jgi:hypothetical protein
MTAGKAITKANAHDLSQIVMMLFTRPTLKRLITNDMRHDINNAIKNEKTMC